MKKRTERGFTLVELTVVILVLGVIIAFVLPAFTNKADSSQAKAVGTVSGYLAEYEREHTTDHVDDVTVIHCADDTLYIFGYNFGDKVLWVFSGAWLVAAQGNMKNSGFAVVADNIVKSANNESNAYSDASGIFTGNSNLKNEFSSRTQKKMDGNTVFLNAEIYKNYSITYGGIEYKFIRADGETGENTAAATYTTVFKDADGNDFATPISFSTANSATFTCPDDPAKAGKQFLYWELIYVGDEQYVNGETEELAVPIKATALVPGEEYDVPNSNVVYKAVFGSTTPERVDGVYQIYGPQHMVWLSQHVEDGLAGANAKLCRSFEWDNLVMAPIGTSAHPYHGTFDGNGKTIMNVKFTAAENGTHTALFGYTDGATIKDLTLTTPTITGNTYVSALVAEAVATVDATGEYTSPATKITNCKIVGANITCADVKAADGATPEQIETLAQTAVFKDRYEVQNVDVGGILTPTAVLTQTEQGTYCGGLVGFGENVEIKESSVSGIINGGNNGVAVGGIMGCACGTRVKIGTSGSTKIGASTDATVSGVRYVGGLIGKTTDSAQIAAITPAVTVTTGVEIYNSYNAGEVTRNATVMVLPQEGYLKTTYTNYCTGFGGLVGGTRGGFLTITGCDTTKNAKVTPLPSEDSNLVASIAGGLLGYAEKGEIEINQSKNNAPVSARKSVGGIVGASRDVRLIVKDSENNGKVFAKDISAGGILGYAKTSQTNTRAAKVVQIIDCTNKASVTTVKRAGGIVGEAERTVTITGAKNTAKVTESFKNLWELEEDTGCGGIVGYSVGKLMLTDCENSGDVISSCEGVGGIVGRATSVTVDKVTNIPTVDDINGTEPLTPTVPVQVTLTSNLSEITKCVNTGNVKNIAKAEDLLADPDATPTPTPVEPTPTPDPLATPDPTPAAPYKYAGGIVGYADKVVLIDYCINAAYIQGNTNVGGIAGALVKPEATPTPTPTATVNPNIVNRDPEPGEPTPTPTPTQSAIRHSISVGIVESNEADAGVAGAIIATDEWAINYTRNVYLTNMVQFTGTNGTEILQNVPPVGSENPARAYGTERTAAQFILASGQSGNALDILNGDIVAPDTPVYTLPDTSDPQNQPTFAYKKSLTDAIAAYAALPTPVTITLPTFLPVFVTE